MAPIVDKHGQPTPFLSLTWREAEARFGRRLDRRRGYAVYEGDELELLTVSRWTQYCTGCTEVPEMGVAPEVGIGCHECGHTGKRRVEMWVPALPAIDSDEAYDLAGLRSRNGWVLAGGYRAEPLIGKDEE